jgi:hypothetical protein
MHCAQDERQECDDALLEQVEKQDSSRTAQEPVDNHYCLAGRGLGRCIAVPFKTNEGRLLECCGLVVRVPGYTKELCCVYCEVRTEYIYVM